MNPENILKALKQFTDRERIEFLPLAPDSTSLSEYAPIHKYALDLKNGAKPESAAEDLFTALWKDILGVQPTRQVGVTEGFVDFMVPERLGDPLRRNWMARMEPKSRAARSPAPSGMGPRRASRFIASGSR